MHDHDNPQAFSNVFINGLPSTGSRKFIYADDICLAAQRHNRDEVKEIPNQDLEKTAMFFRRWRLKPTLSKTICSAFHLHHASADQKLNLLLNGQEIRHEPNAVYLRVTMDRSLTFRAHLKKSAAKLLLEIIFSACWPDLRGLHRLLLLEHWRWLCATLYVAEYCSPV